MRKILIGCGVLVGFVVMVLVIGGIVAASWFKKRFPDMARIEDLQKEVRDRFGPPEAFVPPTDGRLPADRIAIFAAMRDSLAIKRDAAAVGLGQFVEMAERAQEKERDPHHKPNKIEELSQAYRMATDGAAMFAGAFDYATTVQRTMLATGMGLGEYQWYYVLTTWAWLGFDPRQHAGDTRDVVEHVDREYRELARNFDQQLENARRALEAKPSRTPDEEAFLERLRRELEDSGRSGARFASALPEGWEAALRPHRGKLQAALPDRPVEVLLDLITDTEDDHFKFDWQDRRRRRSREAETESTLSI